MTGRSESRVGVGRPLPVGQTLSDITRELADIPLNFPKRVRWALGFSFCSALLLVWFVSIAVLFTRGVGVWGINIPVGWGLAIANVIWWIGIGHAGTLISSLLLMTGSTWRNSLNRFAEAMTIFAVICAATYPVLHLGRPILFFWMIPHPDQLGLGPQYRSPLEWDIFAIVSYMLVSVIFWYVGLIPDLAAVRDRAKSRGARIFYGVLALGWQGSAAAWTKWRRAYIISAGFALPLVVSVHSGVAMLLAAGPIPGWHTTLFPPYFVLGAVFSGFAVVAMLAVFLRHGFGLRSLITTRHLEMVGAMLLTSGLMTLYGYVFEAFSDWYSGDPFDRATLADRVFGPYAWAYWGAVIGNFGPLQLLWFDRVRRSPVFIFAIGLCAAVGMWLERFMLVVSGLGKDFLPSSYDSYWPSGWEWSLFAGSIGLFGFLFFIFIRIMPVISIFEEKEVLLQELAET